MVYRHDNIVVCGIDGSPASLNALEWAASEARTRRATLEILCCYEEPTYGSHHGNESHGVPLFKEEAERHLAHAKARVSARGIEIVTRVSAEDPTRALLESSKRVARVVIGSRGGSGGFADRFLGSVASAVSARAYCAVVIVPSTPVHEILPVRHMICGFDGSESSHLALALAVREASRWGAKLTCVSAVNFSGGTWLPNAAYHQEVLDDVREGLREAVADVREGYDVDVHTHAIEGNAPALLSEFSTAVDAIVLGTRGRGGFTGLLLGSTSQAVIAHSTCPVIVVPRRTRDNEDTTPLVPWSRPARAHTEELLGEAEKLSPTPKENTPEGTSH